MTIQKVKKQYEKLLKDLVELRIDRDTKFGVTVWIGNYDAYMHIEDTLVKLIINIVKEYRNDKHLIG